MGAFVSSQAFQPPVRRFVRFQNPANVHFRDLPKSGVRAPLLYVASGRTNAKTLLFSHGNAEDLMSLEPFATFLVNRLGVNFCAFEYPGYPGTTWLDEQRNAEPLVPSEGATFEAAESCLDWLISDRKTPVGSIVIMGRSLGSGPSVHLAAVHCVSRGLDCGGLVLQSPIASAVRVVFPNSWFTLPFIDIFANIDKIGSVRCRTTVIHGTADEVVPLQNGQQLFAAVPAQLQSTPLWLAGAHHNDVEQFTEQWLGHISAFLDSLE
jgi:abhydrolase domain-containing protein 17